MVGAVMLSLSIFRAAMFAEPTITEIEEVVGLDHGAKSRTDIPVCLSYRKWALGKHPGRHESTPTFLSGTSLPTFLLGKTDRQECLSYFNGSDRVAGLEHPSTSRADSSGDRFEQFVTEHYRRSGAYLAVDKGRQYPQSFHCQSRQ
jgi:hypothetical protein